MWATAIISPGTLTHSQSIGTWCLPSRHGGCHTSLPPFLQVHSHSPRCCGSNKRVHTLHDDACQRLQVSRGSSSHTFGLSHVPRPLTQALPLLRSGLSHHDATATDSFDKRSSPASSASLSLCGVHQVFRFYWRAANMWSASQSPTAHSTSLIYREALTGNPPLPFQSQHAPPDSGGASRRC